MTVGTDVKNADQEPDGLAALERKLLLEYLTSANKVATRMQWSRARVAPLMPLDANAVAALSDEDEEKLDALLLRFNSLTAMIQDHVTRALLKVEEEDIKDRSRKDQRLLMEKLGAFDPSVNFGSLDELRNRIAHHYPDDTAKQAEILNAVYDHCGGLLDAYNGVLSYVDSKFFSSSLDLPTVSDDAGLPVP